MTNLPSKYRVLTDMMKKRLTNYFILILVVNLLTNAIALTFHEEVLAHELDHHHHHQHTHDLDHHHSNLIGDEDLEYFVHLYLHAAGQHQPFCFTLLPLLTAVKGKEILAAFSYTNIPEEILDLPYRPPRNTSVS
ncbi:hypothetical protein [Nitrosomonas aestuarii]|nr:hypothetical protein [Nitrosomonas aestuarii]